VRRLLLVRPERSQLALSCEHALDSGRSDRTRQLVFEVPLARVEPDTLELGAIVASQRPQEMRLLPDVVEARVPDVAVPPENTWQVSVAAHRDDGDALGLEVAAAAAGKRLDGETVARSLDEQHPIQPHGCIRSGRDRPGTARLDTVPPHVSWIAIAPVKGLALLHPESVRLERFGVLENRRFHLIGEDGRLLNGKQLAPLVQIRAEWDEEAQTLAFGFPDGNVLERQIDLGEKVSTSFYGRRLVDGRVVVGPWSDAISEFVGQPLRLVQPAEIGTGVDRAGGQVSILSNGSLRALGQAAGVSEPVDPRRFRMLFGVEGIAAHEEDEWVKRRVQIGEAEVEVAGNVGRCLVTSRHPDSGARNLPTLDVLAEYRGAADTTERLAFGVWGMVTRAGVVRLGDPVVA
jgi:uncharacterized protein YcbX